MWEFVATNTIAVGVVGYLFKLWFDKRLQTSLDKELEKFRSDIQKDIARYSIQQEWNNSKRMELFSELYNVIVDADFELKAFLLNIKCESEEHSQVRARNFCEKYTEVNALLHKNELFIDTEVVTELRSCYKPYFDEALKWLGGEPISSALRDNIPETIEDITKVADEPRQKAVKIFKKLSRMEA